MFRFRLARLWRAGSIFCGSLPGIPVFAWTAARYWIPHAQRHSCRPKVPFSRCPKGPQWPPRAMQALANTRATQEHPSLGAQLLPCPLEVNCFHEGPNWHPAGHDMAPRLLPCRFEEVWRASAGRLDWIALAGCLARLWIKNARANFEHETVFTGTGNDSKLSE